MKDKTIAAILAFFGGIIGLQRFYLGQKGMGMAQLFFFVLAVSYGATTFTFMLLSLAMVFGIIDAISFLSMEPREFDLRYNQAVATSGSRTAAPGPPRVNMSNREQRFQERQRQRAEREREQELRDKERFQQRTETVTSDVGARQPVAGDPGRSDRERGVALFRDYEYAEATDAFRAALKKNPRDVAAHFNIACAYSVQEEADRAFYHLDRAVSLGFDDFDRIMTHDSLAYLRVQRAYPAFADKQFRLATSQPQSAPNVDDPIVGSNEPAPAREAPVHDELLEQLQRLAALREKGLLTDLEFTAQKRRLLG